MSSLDDALTALEPLVQQRDALALDRQSALARLLTPEQRATWQSMDQEYAARATEIADAIATTKAQIQEEVLTLGTSVKGLYWQAIHSEGRVQWDLRSPGHSRLRFWRLWCRVTVMKRYTIYITDAELAALQRLSDQTELATAELVRRALDQYLATPQVTYGHVGTGNVEQRVQEEG